MDDLHDDDVLSLSAHESWSTEGKSELSELDMETAEFIVVDEVIDEPEPTQAIRESKVSVHQDAMNELVAGSSSRAPGPVEDSASATPKSRMRTCYVCGVQTREKMRRHVLKCHLPWFWSASTACWECCEQETQPSSLAVRHSVDHKIGCGFDDNHLHLWCLLLNGSLHLLASWLDCDGLDSLLAYVVDRELHAPLRSGFSDQEVQFLMFYVQTYSPNLVPEIVFRPPNHVACLTNWEIMASLLRRVSPAKQKQFVGYSEFLTYEGSSIIEPVTLFPEPFLFIDSHFHLDLVLPRLRFQNFLHMQSVISPSDNSSGLYYGIANFVFPRYWDNWKATIGYARTVFATFGIHPHVASDVEFSTYKQQLESFLREDLCVGIGEIGLDYTTKCRCRPCHNSSDCVRRIQMAQEEVFLASLSLARLYNMPVVLHCRDGGDGSAALRVFQLIVEYGYTDLSFHRHCFVGGADELRQWLTLPNVVVGVTWRTVKECASVIPRIPAANLVLESDAPFLSPTTCGPTNHPWNLRFVAEETARLRNSPLSVLSSTINQNAITFYRLSERLSGCNR